MARGKGKSDFSNGLGPDKFYVERIGTDLPALMFHTDSRGYDRDMVTLERIQEQANKFNHIQKEA